MSEIPSSDFKVELVQGNVKAAITATGAKARDMLMVPVDQIKVVAGLNIRIQDADYEKHVERVKNSIIENGFYPHMPLSGYAGKEGDLTFIYLTGGFTRFEAVRRAIAIGTPIEAVPVVLKPAGTSMVDLTLALAMDNINHPLKPYERGIVIKRLIGYGAEPDTIATKMGVSGQYVTDLLYLMALPMEIQQLVITGKCSAGHAIATARKEGANALKVLQAAIQAPAPTAGTPNGATAPRTAGRATPARTAGAAAGTTIISKKVYIAAIDYAIALPDGLEWLTRWVKADKDAVAELASTMGKKVKAKSKAQEKREAVAARKKEREKVKADKAKAKAARIKKAADKAAAAADPAFATKKAETPASEDDSAPL